MTRPLPSRLKLAVATLLVASLAACASPTAPSSNTPGEEQPKRGGGVYGGSNTMCGGGVYGGSSTC